MNTENLKEFIVLAETKNFWEASERLYMNQSTLSKHIKNLESELGISLFTRTTRRVELTNYGRIFLPYAKSVIRSEFEGLSAIRRLQNIENGLLTIGVIPSMPQYHITQFLTDFQKAYPQTSIRITEDDPVNLMQYLEDEKCELIFQREEKMIFEKNFITDQHIIRLPYMQDNLVAIVPPSHPLATLHSVSLQQLKNERLCLIKDVSNCDGCLPKCKFCAEYCLYKSSNRLNLRYGRQPKLCCLIDGCAYHATICHFMVCHPNCSCDFVAVVTLLPQ